MKERQRTTNNNVVSLLLSQKKRKTYMDIFVIIILIVSLLSFSLQLTFFSHKWVEWAYAGLIATGIYIAYPQAIEQSYSTIQQTMNDAQIIGDFSALVIAEALLGCLLSIWQTRILYGENRKKIGQYAHYFVGVAFFISIFYVESFLFINILGIDFQLLAIALSIGIPLFLLGIKQFLQWLVPEKEVRIELKFFLHITQITLAIVLSILILRLPIANNAQQTNIIEFLILLALTLIVAIAGYITYHLKLKKIWNS